MTKLIKLWLEIKIGYYKWALDNINKAMEMAQKQINQSDGVVRNFVCEDLLELAEDRINVKVKINRLEHQLNK